jgi:hypothetical protein
VLEFIHEADAVEGPDPFPVSLLESLRRLVPADNAAYDEIDRDRREELALVVSDEDEPIAECAAESEERLALLWRIVPEHPLCVYQAATGDTAAVKVSDLMSYERLRSTAIYSDWYALACVRDEIEVGISRSKRVTRNFLLQRHTGIAAAMLITTGTAHKHLEHIYDKLDVSSRTEAVARAFSIAGGQRAPSNTANPPL